ncbi:hypothetical protein WSM22_36580 [Cytophagales bacterium WSM2-2]|nr:hypothetical protein WSM22_36580 [Cytophagales bacterium WSM2-2]
MGQTVVSLRQKLATQPNDTVRVNLLTRLADKLYRINKDSAHLCADEAIRLATELKYNYGLMRANLEKGSLMERKNRKQALEYYRAALDLARQLHLGKYEAQSLNYAGNQMYMLGKYSDAEDYYQKALVIDKANKNLFRVVIGYTNLGMTYTKLTDYSRAFDALTQSSKLADSLGLRANLGGNYVDIASIFELQNKHDEAIAYYDKAISAFLQEKDTALVGYASIGKCETLIKMGQYDQAIPILSSLVILRGETPQQFSVYQDLGVSFMGMNKFAEAELYFLKAQKFNDQVTQTPFFAFQNQLALARLYHKNGKLAQGLTAAHKAEQLSLQLGSLQNTKECFQVISGLYEAKGDLKLSLVYQKKFAALQDSIAQIDQNKKLAEAETKFGLTEKNREVLLLEKENELQKARERLSDSILIVLIGVVIFIALGSMLLWRAYKRSNAKSELLAAQKAEIEKANLLITEQSEKLTAADKMKSRFFANISHELRTPVTLITGMLEFMAEGNVPNKEKERAQIALGNSRKLNAIVEEMLDLTRLEASKIVLKKKNQKVIPLLNRITNAFSSLFERNQIRLINDLPSQNVFAELDESYFEKILNNLIYNAIKFTPSGGWVRVNTVISKEKVEINVSDSGSGIATEDLPYIFDRFYQSTSGAQRHDSKGTGIGLSLVKEFTELHGGGVNVTSAVGKGSVFTVWFPLAAPDPDQITSPDFDETTFTWVSYERKPEVMLVEDHEEMRTYIMEVLGHNFAIHQAANGEEALLQLASKKIDLIISDVMMPRMDGYTLLSKLKADDALRHIPVIMLTARAGEEDKLHGLSLGVDDYMVKPFNTTELKIRVQNLLLNHASRKEWQLKPALPEEKIEVKQGESDFMKAVEEFVEARISNTLIAVGDLASHLALSERQLYRKAGELTGLAPAQLIKEIRLKKAYQLLTEKKVSKVAELAGRVGYDSHAYFSKQFMERFGKRPTEMLQ